MKRYSILFAGLLLAAVSCQEKETGDNGKDTPAGVFTITAAPSSVSVKATMNSTDGTVSWKDDDALSVVVVSKNVGTPYKFTRHSVPNQFVSSSYQPVADRNDYYIVYPYTETLNGFSNGVVSGTFSIGKEELTQNGINNARHISPTYYGLTTVNGKGNAIVNLKKGSSTVRISVMNMLRDNLTVNGITLRADSPLAGDYTLGGDGIPEISLAGNTSNSVHLAVTDAIIPFGEAASFYVSCAPVTLAEGKMYIDIETDGAPVSYEKKISAGGLTFTTDEMVPIVVGSMGSGTEDDPFILETASSLLDMKKFVNPTGKTYFKLEKDIDMAEISNWSPVNSSSSAFICFDGNGKSIMNYKITGNVNDDGEAVDPSFFGLFVGECKDLNFKDFDVTVTSGKISTLGVFASEMGGEEAVTKLTNVTFNGKFDVSGVQLDDNYTCTSAGVVAGKTLGVIEVDGCTVDATVNGPMTSDFAPGVNKRGKFKDSPKIEQCYGMYFGESDEDVTINNSVSKGQLVIYGKIAGGFIATVKTYPKVNIMNSCNMADLYGGNNVAGFIGNAQVTMVTVEDSHNEGHIEAMFDWGDSNNAGLIGSAQHVTLRRSYSTGFLGLTSNTSAGLIGKVVAEGNIIENCYCILPNVPNGWSGIGGIVGEIGSSFEITNCYVAGEKIIARQQGIGGIIGTMKSATTENLKTVRGCIVQIDTLAKNMEGDNPENFNSAGAIVGVVLPTSNVGLENCWRNSDMVIAGPTGVVWKQPYDQDNVASSEIFLWPAYDTSIYTKENHRPYHGKSMNPGETVSQKAQALGWDSTVWDFSGDLPTLK